MIIPCQNLSVILFFENAENGNKSALDDHLSRWPLQTNDGSQRSQEVPFSEVDSKSRFVDERIHSNWPDLRITTPDAQNPSRQLPLSSASYSPMSSSSSLSTFPSSSSSDSSRRLTSDRLLTQPEIDTQLYSRRVCNNRSVDGSNPISYS